MAAARFLTNSSLWQEITRRVQAAKHVSAAVAYMGQGAAQLLPLGKGHRLVVNMSMQAVKAGETDPREVRKLMARGAKAFSRAKLHAKFLVVDRCLIASSANISNNSARNLDEAGVLTTDPAAIRRAQDFFRNLCTEPIRPEYLAKCLKAYRPPSFADARGAPGTTKRSKRAVSAKLWYIGGLEYRDVPAREQRLAEGAETRAARLLTIPEASHVTSLHWGSKPRYYDAVRDHDWVVCCFEDTAGQCGVWAPAQVLTHESYVRGHGKHRYLLLLEEANNAQSMRLAKFRTRVRKLVPELDRRDPRTRPIADEAEADAILRLWTPSGRISKRRSR